MVVLSADSLRAFAAELLAAGGATESEARHVASSLVDANLCGYDSHGVMRVPYYVDAISKGEVIAGATLEIIRESASHVMADGGWGFGQVVTDALLDRLGGKLQQGSAVAVGTLRHAGHAGRLGAYCERAARSGWITLMTVNTHGGATRVAPPGGKAPRLGTNPLAIGVPSRTDPLVLDFSTSVTAEGKVRVLRIAGRPCPPGWLLDADGRPTTDPNALYGDPPGTILPMGGDQAYRGFGLGLMIEILSGALSDGQCAQEPLFPRKGNCVFLTLIDPNAFGGIDAFTGEVTRLAEFVKSCPRVEGVDEILLPGDPERANRRRREQEGIPLDDENFEALAVLARRLGVSVPPSMS